MNEFNAVYFAVALSLVQIALAVVLGTVFLRLRRVERDTLLPEEQGVSPILDAKGAGRIGRSGWSRSPFCRITVYENFLVACVKSNRVLVRYKALKSVDTVSEGKAQLRLGYEVEDSEALEVIEFSTKEPARLIELLRARQEGA